jgi:hypothetical protein
MLTGTAVLAAAAGGAVLVRRRFAGAAGAEDRWHSVTVNRTPEEVGSLPGPLAELGTVIEVRVRPAPGDRGTELAARVVEAADRETVGRLRRALREAKQLAEIGEVVRPDSPPTTDRTLVSRPLAWVTRHGREEGRL